MAELMAWPVRVRVVGVTRAPGYPRNLADLAPAIAHDGHAPVELHRDLDNVWADDARVVRCVAAKVWWGHSADALPVPGAVLAVGPAVATAGTHVALADVGHAFDDAVERAHRTLGGAS